MKDQLKRVKAEAWESEESDNNNGLYYQDQSSEENSDEQTGWRSILNRGRRTYSYGSYNSYQNGSSEPTFHGGNSHSDEEFEFRRNGDAYALDDFDRRVEEFDPCNEIWTQHDYDERLQTEAEIMIALEAIRMTLVTIDNDLHSLEICIKEADGMIDINYGFIETNQRSIQWNTEEVEI